MYRRACSQQQSNSQDGTIPQILKTMQIFNILNKLCCFKQNYCAPNFDNINSDEIHGLADSLLHPPLDLLLLLLREVSLGVATGWAVVSHGQLVVVLAGSVSHQMGVVGRGWVGHRPKTCIMYPFTCKKNARWWSLGEPSNFLSQQILGFYPNQVDPPSPPRKLGLEKKRKKVYFAF